MCFFVRFITLIYCLRWILPNLTFPIWVPWAQRRWEPLFIRFRKNWNFANWSARLLRLQSILESSSYLACFYYAVCIADLDKSLTWFGSLILGSSKFLLLPQMPQKILLAPRMVKSDLKNLLNSSKTYIYLLFLNIEIYIVLGNTLTIFLTGTVFWKFACQRNLKRKRFRNTILALGLEWITKWMKPELCIFFITYLTDEYIFNKMPV